MSETLQALADNCREAFGEAITNAGVDRGELTLEVRRAELLNVCRLLRDHPRLAFEQLIEAEQLPDALGFPLQHWPRAEVHPREDKGKPRT